MSITRIARLRDYGVFRNFTWPSDLPEFGRYNLVYGWNGTGKTMLSRLFRDLEAKTPPSTGQVSMSVNGRDVSNAEFSEVSVAVRVFNRDFVQDTVFPAAGDVAPIFVLGKQNVEKQKEVERLKASLAKAQADGDSNYGKSLRAGFNLDRFCINRAKVIKDTLRSSGPNPYNNYDKSHFSRRARGMIEADDRQAHELSDGGREKLLAQHRAAPKSKLQPITYRLPALKALADAVSDLLSTTVVSAIIQSLKDDPELSLWAHQGLGLHQDRQATKCLFCGETIPKDRLAALEAHFSTEYEQFLKKLDGEVAALRDALKAAADLLLPNAAQLYDDLSSEYKAAQAGLRGERDSARRVLEALVKAVEEKRSRAFERVKLNVAVPDLNTAVVDRLNEVILKHNQVCDNFQSRIDNAGKRLETDSVAGDLEEFVKLRGAVQASQIAVKAAAAEVDRLKGEIARLESEIVEHQQPAEELNDDLRSYLGHGELRLEIKETGYTIMRHDASAAALSEGETTAIALLYFLKSLQDRRFDLRKGVVVLDDPVSSLDANALYSAFGFIRERTQHAAQLVILTHNFTFFRQVRNWFRHLKGQKKKDMAQRPARFYMLDCTYKEARRCASIRWLDPLLEQFESEYHYLFACVCRVARGEPQPSLEQNYVLPNLARRLLETFLAFRQPSVSGDLWQKMQLVKFDEARKIRILRFVHTYSHGGALGEAEHDLSLLSEAQAILKDILTLMQSEDADHYSAMASLVRASDSQEDS
ncbi:MAG TPA: AAA family ATPase [Phycisphaerae bacterium]|nr:AAA family ATPase [Phycisphaerae bacterium]